MPKGIYKRTKHPWNFGLTKETDERVSKNADARTGLKRLKKSCKNISNGHKSIPSNFKGKHHTPEAIEKNRKAHLNKLSWNKNLTKETDIRVKNNGKEISKSWNNKTEQEMDEFKEKISLIQKGQHHSPNTEFKMGNKTPKGDICFGKGCYYNSPFQGQIWLRSSWELKYAQYLDEHNILWTYETIAFPLTLNDHKTTYRPDFYLINYDIYIEIKGNPNGNADKIKQFRIEYPDIKLQVLFKEDLLNWGINLRYRKIQPKPLNTITYINNIRQ